jgi:hypothetical protein
MEDKRRYQDNTWVKCIANYQLNFLNELDDDTVTRLFFAYINVFNKRLGRKINKLIAQII